HRRRVRRSAERLADPRDHEDVLAGEGGAHGTADVEGHGSPDHQGPQGRGEPQAGEADRQAPQASQEAPDSSALAARRNRSRPRAGAGPPRTTAVAGNRGGRFGFWPVRPPPRVRASNSGASLLL